MTLYPELLLVYTIFPIKSGEVLVFISQQFGQVTFLSSLQSALSADELCQLPWEAIVVCSVVQLVL